MALPQTLSLEDRYSLDEGPVRWRIGWIELATGEVAELDLRRLLPAEVGVYTARVMNSNPVKVANLREHKEALRLATAQLIPDADLDVIVYDCTSGTAALGYATVADEIRAVRPSARVVTPLTAARAAFQRLGVDRISLVTPYSHELNELICRFLIHEGLEVVSIGSFLVDDDHEMSRITPESILEAAVGNCHPEAECLFIPCTALRAAEIIDAAERELGKPVVSAVQASLWQSLRFAGYEAPIAHAGRLFL
jgi:maleate isomerase